MLSPFHRMAPIFGASHFAFVDRPFPSNALIPRALKMIEGVEDLRTYRQKRTYPRRAMNVFLFDFYRTVQCEQVPVLIPLNSFIFSCFQVRQHHLKISTRLDFRFTRSYLQCFELIPPNFDMEYTIHTEMVSSCGVVMQCLNL